MMNLRLRSLEIKLKEKFSRIRPIIPLILTIFIVIVIIAFVYLFLYFEPDEEIEQLEFLTRIDTEEGNLICKGISEDYTSKSIKIPVSIRREPESKTNIHIKLIAAYYDKKKGKYSKNLISFEDVKFSHVTLEYLWGDKDLMINHEKEDDFFFDLEREPCEKEVNATINIYISDLFALKENKRIFFIRTFEFIDNSQLEEEIPLKFILPPKFEIGYLTRHHFLNSNIKNLNIDNNIMKAESKEKNFVHCFIELGESYESKALKYTKFGIFIAVIFAGITLIVTVYYGQRNNT